MSMDDLQKLPYCAKDETYISHIVPFAILISPLLTLQREVTLFE